MRNRKQKDSREKNRIALCLRRILLLYLSYVFVCLVIPPLFHRTANEINGQAVEALAEQEARQAQEENLSEQAGMLPAQAEPSPQERALCIDNNMDALLWRLRLIEAAQERIVLATFDFRDDNSGQDMMAVLFQAAERGVEVQIVVDGINGTLWLNGSRHFRELAAHENVQVRLYNPINFLKPWRVNYRMHDKYLIADDFAWILGGRNTDDLFLGNYAESCNDDRDILVYETVPGEGVSYRQLQAYYEQIWNLPCARPYRGGNHTEGWLAAHYQEVRRKYPEAFTEPEWEQETFETESVVLCTNPAGAENKQPVLWERMMEEMKRADDILIQTPYIICSEKMYQDLTDVTQSASKVEVITNAVEGGANPFGCTDYLNQKKKIRETGLHVYEYLGPQALHTKTILAGDSVSFVGSCNLDMRSVYLDTEMMLRIDSPALNAAIREQAEGLKAMSRHVSPDGTTVDGEDYRPVSQNMGKKALYGILRIVIIPFRHLL